MILVLTSRGDATADYLIPLLEKAGIGCVRLDTDSFLSDACFSYRNGRPLVSFGDERFSPADFRHVWYRRPERLVLSYDLSPEEETFAVNEWSEVIEGFLAHIPTERWMNHPSINAAASSKIEQLSVAARIGFETPDTLVTQDGNELRDFANLHDGRIICKPLSAGLIQRENDIDSLIYTNKVESDHLKNLEDLQACPTLFQQAVDKVNDLRITVVDGRIQVVELLASDESGAQRCDIRRNNMLDVSYRQAELPDHIESLVKSFTRHYRLRFAAIDMAVDTNGNHVFFEVNPNGQWAWLDIVGGMSIVELFVEAFSDD